MNPTEYGDSKAIPATSQCEPQFTLDHLYGHERSVVSALADIDVLLDDVDWDYSKLEASRRQRVVDFFNQIEITMKCTAEAIAEDLVRLESISLANRSDVDALLQSSKTLSVKLNGCSPAYNVRLENGHNDWNQALTNSCSKSVYDIMMGDEQYRLLLASYRHITCSLEAITKISEDTLYVTARVLNAPTSKDIIPSLEYLIFRTSGESGICNWSYPDKLKEMKTIAIRLSEEKDKVAPANFNWYRQFDIKLYHLADNVSASIRSDSIRRSVRAYLSKEMLLHNLSPEGLELYVETLKCTAVMWLTTAVALRNYVDFAIQLSKFHRTYRDVNQQAVEALSNRGKHVYC